MPGPAGGLPYVALARQADAARGSQQARADDPVRLNPVRYPRVRASNASAQENDRG
jgi:hypothetical protein